MHNTSYERVRERERKRGENGSAKGIANNVERRGLEGNVFVRPLGPLRAHGDLLASISGDVFARGCVLVNESTKSGTALFALSLPLGHLLHLGLQVVKPGPRLLGPVRRGAGDVVLDLGELRPPGQRRPLLSGLFLLDEEPGATLERRVGVDDRRLGPFGLRLHAGAE